MKPNATTPTSEANRTVLMVDGHGHIRTIRKFHQKLWIGIAAMAGCLLIALAAGWLFFGGLKTQKALRAQIEALKTQLTQVEHQKELLLARAIKAESRNAPPVPAPVSTPAPNKPSTPPATVKDKPAATPTAKAAPVATAPKEKAPPAPAPPPVISVGVEKLKVDYDQSAKALSAGFVVRNTGNTQAEGRAVVVLSSSQGGTVPRLSLPPVPLKNDRPRGNRGRRFSISRFMRLKLKRKVAEPGLSFDTADVYVFDMQGKLLQEKTFEVAVTIPTPPPPPPPAPPVQPEPPSPAAVAPPPPPAIPAPAAPAPAAPAPATTAPAAPSIDQTGNSILAIPSNSEQEPQGGQED